MAEINRKQNIIALVRELRKRTGRQKDEIVAEIDTHIGMTMGIFDSLFCHHPERKTYYEVDQVVHLIRAFKHNLPSGEGCTAFEAVLLANWSGTGLDALTQLGKRLYHKREIDHAIRVYMDEVDNRFNWFDVYTRKRVQQRLRVEKADNNKRGHHTESGAPTTEQVVFANVSISDWASSERALSDALDVRNFDTPFAESEFYHTLGKTQIKKGNHTQAQIYLTRAFDIATTHNASNLEAIIANIGANSFYKGNFVEAESAYRNGLRIANSRENLVVAAFVLNSLGAIAAETGRHDDALAFYTDTLKLGHRTHNIQRIAYAHLNIGALKQYMGQLDHSRNHYMSGLAYATQIAHFDLVLQIHWYLASLDLLCGNLTEGREQLRITIEQAATIKLIWIETGARIDMGKLLLRDYAWTKATGEFERSLWFARKIQNPILAAKSIYGLVLVTLAQQSLLRCYETNEALETIGKRTLTDLTTYCNELGISEQHIHSAHSFFCQGMYDFPSLDHYKVAFVLNMMLTA